MIQDSACKQDKPPFDSYGDLTAAGVDVKMADLQNGGPEYPPGGSHQCTGIYSIWHVQQLYNRLNIIEVSKAPLVYYYVLLNYIILYSIILFKYEIPPFDVCFLGGLANTSVAQVELDPLQDCLLPCRVCSPASMSSTIKTFAPKMLLSLRSTVDG